MKNLSAEMWGAPHLRQAALARTNKLIVPEGGPLKERFPDGLLLTLSQLVYIDSIKDDPTRVSDLVSLMSPWVDQITAVDAIAEIREGANNDIVEVLRSGRTSRFSNNEISHTSVVISHFLPWSCKYNKS